MVAYRQEQRTTTVGAAVEDAISELTELAGEMRERADNTPEGLQSSSTYETVDSTASELENHDTAPDVPADLAEITVQYVELVQRRKGRGTSRATRCANACAMLGGAADALDAWLENEKTKDDENRDATETLRDECREIADACESLEFPGMRG